MSESSKMGLFGSKDKTNETKKEGTKEESPDRYAPYCIDSDSETYDTEALSMMDINDIIGVQSEPVSESTLESEIAALTQIITESKGDGIQSVTETKHETLEEDDLSLDQQLMGVDSIEAIRKSNTNDQFKNTLEELESVCGSSQMSVCDMDQLTAEKSQSSNKSSILDNLKLNVTSSSINPNLKDNREPDVLSKSLSMTVLNKVVGKDSIVVTKSGTQVSQTVSTGTSKMSENINIEEIVNRLNMEQIDNGNVEKSSAKFQEKAIENISSISGSLQLIGEAYTSEDSQESYLNDAEPTEASPTISFNKTPLTSCIKEEGEMKEGREKICEPQDNANDVQETFSISSIKPCIKEQILATVEQSAETCTNEVPATIEHSAETCTNEVPATVEHSAETRINEVPATVEHVAEMHTNEVHEAVEHSAETCTNKIPATVEQSPETCANEVHATVEHSAETCINEGLATVAHSAETCTQEVPATVDHSAETCTQEIPAILEHSAETCTQEVPATVDHSAETCTQEIPAIVEHSAETCTQEVPATVDHSAETCTQEIPAIVEHSAETCTSDVPTTVDHSAETCTIEVPATVEYLEQTCTSENISAIAEHSQEKCTNQNIPVTSDDQIQDGEVDTSNVCIENEIKEELSCVSESPKDIAIVDCNEYTVLSVEKDECNETHTNVTDIETIRESEQCKEKINDKIIMEQDKTIEETKINNEIADTSAEECVPQIEECESKKMEEDTTGEYKSIDTIDKELIGEVTESNHLETTDDHSDNGQLVNTESIDKMDTESKAEDNEEEIDGTQKIESLSLQVETIEHTPMDEIEKLDPVDTIDNCNVLANTSNLLESLQTDPEMSNKVLETQKEIQHDPVQSFRSQLSPRVTESVDIEKDTAPTEKTEFELSLQIEDLCNNAVTSITDTITNAERKIKVVDLNLDLMVPEVDTTEHELIDPSTELPIDQTGIEGELETCAINSTTISKDEVSMEVENDTSILNAPMSTSELDATLSSPVSGNTSILKNETEEMADSVEKNDATLETEMEEVCNIETLKSEDCATEKLDDESNKEEVTATNEPVTDTKDAANIEDVMEMEEQKDLVILQKCKDTNMDLLEDKESSANEEIEAVPTTPFSMPTDQEKSTETPVPNKSLVLQDDEDNINKESDIGGKDNIEIADDINKKCSINETDDIETEENVEQHIIAEESISIVVQSKMNMELNESKDTVDEKEVSDTKVLDINTFSPPFDKADIMVPEEDTEEEGMEEEMNLTLEPEESELQIETNEMNNDSVETTEKEEISVTTNEMDKELERSAMIKVEDNEPELLDVEKSIVDTISTLSNNEEKLPEKQDLEDNLKIEESSDIKDILEPTNDVADIFSDEQCQNTQDIVTSILDNVTNATDFKNILGTETGVASEIEQVLQRSADLPLVEAEIKELAEKLPEEDILNKDMEDSMSAQNIDSLEELLDLDLIPEEEDATLKIAQTEEGTSEQDNLSKDVDMSLLLANSDRAPDISQASDYITDVIGSCLTNENDVLLDDTANKISSIQAIDNKSEQAETSEIVKINETLITCSINKSNTVLDIEKDLEVDADLPENELDMDFEVNPLESVDDLEETESKLELAPDILLPNVDQRENLIDTPSGMESSQPSSEISELESAVKFLQESEEQTIDSPLVLSPKMVESDVDDISKQGHTSSLFVPVDDMCEDASELVAELAGITTDSISISEAEIISEAAKLESEKKLAEQVKIDASVRKFEADDVKSNVIEEKSMVSKAHENIGLGALENIEVQQVAHIETEKKMSEAMSNLSKNVFKPSEAIPKISILEERLKEPPKIEIPTTDVTKIAMSPTTSKDSLLIQKDSKMMIYQRMLESPKMTERSEPKITDTPRKDSEKHDFENVGSPRIILKIAKSAIADCGEPRSPKSPKIRSAANSPNPEDSPGQKLGKIKLKLSKSGHPSIISNENVEESGQWYSEGGSSLSPLGMKIKLSKSGDASIVSSDKFESGDDAKETKHKFEETKRTESPIGMKIKLLKTGDASIVQQDSKEMQIKHKDKLDIVQGSPKRTESPIGMKIKLSKSGDASIIQPDRQDFTEEYRENALKTKDASYNSPKRTESPIGMKIKFSKTGDASIVSPDISDEGKEGGRIKEKLESSPDVPKRTESPIGMKIKLTKTKGGASIISVENTEDAKEKLEIPDVPKRTESPLGMKIKLSKTGDASIIHSEIPEEIKDPKQREKLDMKEKTNIVQDGAKLIDTPSGIKIKVTKSGETSAIVQETTEESEVTQEAPQKVESLIGMKIKLSKFGDASIVGADKQEQMEELKSRESPQGTPKRTESPIGMKIKLSKTGDASIIQTEGSEDTNKIRAPDTEHSKATDAGLGMKIKLLKTGDASIVDPEKKDKQSRRRDTESPLEMKIKLSKTGHPTIVACDTHGDVPYKPKDCSDTSHNFAQRCKETMMHKEPALKILKTGHSTILQSNRSELTIEPVQMQSKKPENVIEISPKRKEITISPIETKKSKLETQLSQILPEVTIQPVMTRDQKHLVFDPKTSSISLQQMNVISQEISITQVRPTKAADTSMSEKLKDILSKNISGSPMSSDCEIIEHRPELIIVNENSNSSQDVMIIEEVPPSRLPEVKVPKKRGRPRRNPIPQAIGRPPPQLLISRDPLCLDQQPQAMQFEHRENERPKRTCRSQKSYAPPKRGRGRGRGKRKLDNVDLQLAKKPRLEQDLSAIEASIMAVITLDESSAQQGTLGKSSELYKALKQPPMDSKTLLEKLEKGQKSGEILHGAVPESSVAIQTEPARVLNVHGEPSNIMLKPPIALLESKDTIKDKKPIEIIPEKLQRIPQKSDVESSDKGTETAKPENKDMLVPPGHPNWLTPTSKRQGESSSRQENVSTVQVIDEETRMSAESGSRSQTPARNISAPASETIVNEESQGSVLSTATTESEKVKVKNRRMEINFDPDEGPFTVDKIAEYEWPLDRKGETFMIQEQISQYLGVKSFKRKYPDLKRRVVDMEERNYLRENGLVSEAMCDMGLTAVCSSEVLDVMCGDFPDQYEEYRKHMRERQIKEHSKKQKELTAAANAEKNRIDLAEMAVQSALSWNVNLNKSRNETRKCSLDLQTFTIHVPKKQQKVEAERKVSHYPVALIPGQYTDYYREYTAAELRYYPLNTVLYGPMRPNERKFDSQSEGSQSDSDSDSSSDDSSSTSSEGTQDTEGSQSTMDDVDMEVVNQKEEIKLKCKMCLKPLNKHSKNEVLIQCGTCNGNVHPSCIDLTLDMVPHIQSYAWQCTDCKTCAQCHDPADEDKMLFCDMCDRGYHIYCVGLRRVPQGRWHCQECAGCANCGSREPGGINSDRNSVAQWQHEYKKGDRNTRVYVSTLCVPCSKLWRKGRYCPHCSRCHTAPRLDLEANLVHCSACDKYLHLGCVETKGLVLDRKNYLCDFCTPNRQQVMKPLVSKIFKT